MNAASPPSADDGSSRERDLPPRARTIGVVVWCSFLVASTATMVLFASLDPGRVEPGSTPPWWTSRHAVYALGFFFFWVVAACAAALAIYMAHTDRPPSRSAD